MSEDTIYRKCFAINILNVFASNPGKIYLFFNETYFQPIDVKWIPCTSNIVERLFSRGFSMIMGKLSPNK